VCWARLSTCGALAHELRQHSPVVRSFADVQGSFGGIHGSFRIMKCSFCGYVGLCCERVVLLLFLAVMKCSFSRTAAAQPCSVPFCEYMGLFCEYTGLFWEIYGALLGDIQSFFGGMSGSVANMKCSCSQRAATQPCGALVWMHRALLEYLGLFWRYLGLFCEQLALLLTTCGNAILWCPCVDAQGF